MTYTQTKECINSIGRKKLEELLKDYGEEAIEAAFGCGIPIKYIEEAYSGHWGSDKEFVEDLLTSTGDLPADLPAYIHIDWEATARDIMLDYITENGYYFRIL